MTTPTGGGGRCSRGPRYSPSRRGGGRGGTSAGGPGEDPATAASGSGSGAVSASASTSATAPGSKALGAPASVLHQPLPDFSLPDLDGRPHRPSEWDGKVLVVNFWATWCAPCREEIPLLIDLERRRPGVRVVGIALDRADAVRAFAEELGIGYPLLLDDLQGSTMRRYGNRFGALPFTVIAGRDGVVAYVRLGELEAGELDWVTETLLSPGSGN